MKILLTGGGSGGHFYPIIAVAEQINLLVKENHLLKPEMYYMSTDEYNPALLFEQNLTFIKTVSGKVRVSPSFSSIILNFIDLFKISWGSLAAVWKIFWIYPDVVFSKGGFASFPALFAAWFLRIPVVLHESDTVPGRVNKWAGKFAKKIATSYPESTKYFPEGKTAYTGNPIRKEIFEPLSVGAHEFLHLDKNIPTVFIMGGSQGAQLINVCVLDALPQLVEKFQIIHQVGRRNIKVVEETRDVILHNNKNKDRYKPFDYLNLLSIRMSAGAADVIVSRAGSSIFEIASWGKASIIIPITNSNGDHQRQNAYAYARAGACQVIEEKNLTSHVLASEITRLIENKEENQKLASAAKAFSRQDSARLIAEVVLDIALVNQK
jgi:UDP-N-acetylglucosamine--N-acetylmuramyl-(pentapeptide) pyrophosphoryl-undecaprenol N-acetylglucosamine transferase